MTAPATAARCFLAAVLFGLGLGPVYGFLRPLRPRYTAAADGLFLIAAFFAWLCHSFAVCGGDIRLGYAIGLPAGVLIWEWTIGMLLRPVFSVFWKTIFFLSGKIAIPVKKF